MIESPSKRLARLREMQESEGYLWLTEKLNQRREEVEEAALKIFKTPEAGLNRNLAVKESETISWVLETVEAEIDLCKRMIENGGTQ